MAVDGASYPAADAARFAIRPPIGSPSEPDAGRYPTTADIERAHPPQCSLVEHLCANDCAMHPANRSVAERACLERVAFTPADSGSQQVSEPPWMPLFRLLER
jgi:hypothetical protein